jgi:hypothetical protein
MDERAAEMILSALPPDIAREARLKLLKIKGKILLTGNALPVNSPKTVIIVKVCNLIIFAISANMAGRISRQSHAVRGLAQISD